MATTTSTAFTQSNRPLAIRALINWLDTLAAVTVGSICTACMLGYVDFRHGALAWRNHFPKLAEFEARFAPRDSMKAWALA